MKLYRCSTCSQVLCDADFKLAPDCPVCHHNRYVLARLVSDDEMKAAIQRGFVYDDKNFKYVDDSLLARGILPSQRAAA